MKKNTTVLPLGCKQYNNIGCIHITMLECKELMEHKIINYPPTMICVICYKQIHVKNQISITCSWIELYYPCVKILFVGILLKYVVCHG